MPPVNGGGSAANPVRVEDRRPLPYSWSEVRSRLQTDVLRLLPALGVTERTAGGLITPRNPNRTDRRPGSFVIWTQGDGAGAWKDYATGEGGDVLDLVAYLLRLRARIDAYWWSLEFLGLDRGVVRSAEAMQSDRDRVERERKAGRARAQAAAADQAAKQFRAWSQLPPLSGTVAEIYLRETRRIDLGRLSELPAALRFSRSERHFDQVTGKVTKWPCMVAAMIGGSGFAGVHKTWLAPDGAGKAPGIKAKKMFGSVSGAAIRLAPGVSGLAPARAVEMGQLHPLIIGEGIETVLTAATARPEYRAWAAGSLSLMGLIAWPACASAVILLRDNDWKPQARKAFEAVEAHWHAQSRGRQVKVVASAVGSDFNDWVRA